MEGVIDKGDYCVRKTLASWHTAMTTEADNSARSLPRQYDVECYQNGPVYKFYVLKAGKLAKCSKFILVLMR